MRFPDGRCVSVVLTCERRFTVYPRPKSSRRELPDFKVKSVLRGTEYESTYNAFLVFLSFSRLLDLS